MVILALVDFKSGESVFLLNFENNNLSALNYTKNSERDQIPSFSYLFSLISGLDGLQISLIGLIKGRYFLISSSLLFYKSNFNSKLKIKQITIS